MHVVGATNLNAEQKLEEFNKRDSDFSYHLVVMCSFMELLANLCFQKCVDEEVLHEYLHTPVLLMFDKLKSLGLLEHLRKQYPHTLKMWEKLVGDWEKKGAPHQALDD